MPLADSFQEIVDSLPSDWTDLEFDLRVLEDRYVDAATLLVTCNAQPYSMHDWHWRLLVAHRFGAHDARHAEAARRRRHPGRARAARGPPGPRRDDPGLGPAGVLPPRVP